MAVIVREERDPAFWQRVILHPAVRHVAYGQDLDIAGIVGNPRILPFATEHGGVIFAQLDSLGRMYEMHRAYEPEGWGVEAYLGLVQALGALFRRGADVVVTYETEHPQSRKPRSFGFRPAGDFQPSTLGPARTWVLTREAFHQSPVWRRACRSQH